MKTIAIANQKGGVGKTTLARNLSFFGLECGLRVLCLDFDPQRNFTRSLRALRERALGDQGYDENALLAQHLFEFPAPDLLPLRCSSHAGLIAATRELSGVLSEKHDDIEEMGRSLSIPHLNLERFEADYDLCVIDTAPTLGNPLYAALIAADAVVCPCTMDQDAIEGLADLFNDIASVRDLGWNAELQTLGLLPNRVNKRRAFDNAALTQLRNDLGDLVMDAVLYDRAATQYAKERPVWQVQSGESQILAAREMKKVCDLILTHAGVVGV